MRKLFFVVAILSLLPLAVRGQEKQTFSVNGYSLILEVGQSAVYKNQEMTMRSDKENFCLKNETGACIEGFTGVVSGVKLILADAKGGRLPKQIYLRERVTTIASYNGWRARDPFEVKVPFVINSDRKVGIITDIQSSGYTIKDVISETEAECDCDLQPHEIERVRFSYLMSFLFGGAYFRQELWLVEKRGDEHLIGTLVWQHTGKEVLLKGMANNSGEVIAAR